jgi:hypothetical protein
MYGAPNGKDTRIPGSLDSKRDSCSSTTRPQMEDHEVQDSAKQSPTQFLPARPPAQQATHLPSDQQNKPCSQTPGNEGVKATSNQAVPVKAHNPHLPCKRAAKVGHLADQSHRDRISDRVLQRARFRCIPGLEPLRRRKGEDANCAVED